MTSTPTFRIGFTGSSLDTVLPWIAEQVGQAPEVAVAMAGSGKDIAYLAAPGRTIRSWDPQELSRVVVQGVFAAPAALPEPVARNTRFGWAYNNQAIKGMPTAAAALADEIATVGSDYDRACLAMALIRCTFHGRLAYWTRDADADTLWAGYLRAHAKLAPWRGLPGDFVHTQGSVFATPDLHIELDGAVLLIDTPKVLTGGAKGDIYSAGFEGLNSILAQQPQHLPPWTEATFRRDMPLLWKAPYSRMLLFHTTGARPTPAQVADAMVADQVPEPLTVRTWQHRGRADICWVVDRSDAQQLQAWEMLERAYDGLGLPPVPEGTELRYDTSPVTSFGGKS